MCFRQLVHLFTETWKIEIFWGEKLKNFSVFKISQPKLVDILPWDYITDWLKWNYNFLFVCPSVGSFAPWKNEMCDILVSFKISLPKLVDNFLLTHLMIWLKWNFKIVFVCPSVGSFVHWKREKLYILLSFQRMFTKIARYLFTLLKNTLA